MAKVFKTVINLDLSQNLITKPDWIRCGKAAVKEI